MGSANQLQKISLYLFKSPKSSDEKFKISFNVFRAEIYKQQGDSTMAIVNYSHAIKLNPDDADIYYNRAALFEEVCYFSSHTSVQCLAFLVLSVL